MGVSPKYLLTPDSVYSPRFTSTATAGWMATGGTREKNGTEPGTSKNAAYSQTKYPNSGY